MRMTSINFSQRVLALASKCFVILGFVLAFNLLTFAQGRQVNLLNTNFDNLTTGLITAPTTTGQDLWEKVLADYGGYGEIQSNLAISGKALHLHTTTTAPNRFQTIVSRPFGMVDVNSAGTLVLQGDFYPSTSNLNAVNNFVASIAARGGPHPGFDLIRVDIGAGNGTPKGQTGAFISLPAYSPTANNIVPIPLTVGQNLAWNTWHSLMVAIDQRNNRYVSVTVDGVKQNLSAYLPSHSFDGTQWLRGRFIEYLVIDLVPDDVGGDRTDDDIYWDNVRLRVLPN